MLRTTRVIETVMPPLSSGSLNMSFANSVSSSAPPSSGSTQSASFIDLRIGSWYSRSRARIVPSFCRISMSRSSETRAVFGARYSPWVVSRNDR